MQEPISIDLGELKFVVKNLRRPGKISRSAFAGMPRVTRQLRRLNLIDNPENRGFLLIKVIEEIMVDRLQATGDAKTREAIAWATLHLQYVERVAMVEIAARLRISSRSVSRYRGYGLVLLGRALLDDLANDTGR